MRSGSSGLSDLMKLFVGKKEVRAYAHAIANSDKQVRGRGSKAALNLRKIRRGHVNPRRNSSQGQPRLGTKSVDPCTDSLPDGSLKSLYLPFFGFGRRL